MEFLSSLWSVTIFPFILTYGSSLLLTALFVVLTGIMIGVLIILSKLVKPMCDFLEALSTKYLSDKVSARVNDAINKIESTMIDLTVIQQETIKKLSLEAYQNDGKIDMKEVTDIAKKMAEITLAHLTPEEATIRKYISGDMIVEWLQDKATSIITQSVEGFLTKKLQEASTGKK